MKLLRYQELVNVWQCLLQLGCKYRFFGGRKKKGDFGFDVGAEAQHLLVKDGMMMMTRPPSHRSC